MNIITPERYSHDILRGNLEGLDVTIQLLRMASRVNNTEEMDFLIAELYDQMKEFKEHFEEHDAEMQFVDKVVEEYRLEKRKAERLEKVGKVIGVVLAAGAIIVTYIVG